MSEKVPEGMTIETVWLWEQIVASARVASALRGRAAPTDKTVAPPKASLVPSQWAALASVNTMLGAAAARCTKNPPPADIEMVPDASGGLIYRCQHKIPHKWKLDGTPI